MTARAEDPASFTIRHAAAADAHAVHECLSLAFAPYRDQYTTGAFADTVITLAAVRTRLDAMRLFVAQDPQGTVIGTIGYSMIDAVEGHIRGLAVRPDAQGCGVASRLLAAAEADMLDRGAARITLDTTRPLERAMQLYERRGYRRSGVTRDFFGMPLVEYVKPLG